MAETRSTHSRSSGQAWMTIGSPAAVIGTTVRASRFVASTVLYQAIGSARAFTTYSVWSPRVVAASWASASVGIVETSAVNPGGMTMRTSPCPGSPHAQASNDAYAFPTRIGLADRGLPLGRSKVWRIVRVLPWYSFGMWIVTLRNSSRLTVVTSSFEPFDVAWMAVASRGSANVIES